MASPIEIVAPLERVWAILTDFAVFPSRNPFVRAIAGQHTPGALLHVTVQPQGGRAMSFKPRLLVFFSGLLVPLVFRGAMRRGTELGFESMNQALKQRAEGRVTPNPSVERWAA